MRLALSPLVFLEAGGRLERAARAPPGARGPLATLCARRNVVGGVELVFGVRCARLRKREEGTDDRAGLEKRFSLPAPPIPADVD